MTKGDRKRGNKEAKKPKKEVAKTVATNDFTKGKAPAGLPAKKK